MSKAVLALLIAIGATTWIYTKFMRTSGSQTQRSVMAAGISGIVIFFMIYIVLAMLGF